MSQQANCTIENGVFYIDGNPMMFLSADYPYYRDHVDNWRDRILSLKAMGCNVITFYVPWRHHQTGEKQYDFTGEVRPNKNVILFLQLVHELGLYAVVKPGPFIHAETDFGGLPDNVSADVIGEAWCNAQGDAVVWHNPLPAPMNPTFRDLSEHWFRAVNRDVVEPLLYPAGPIIALQVLNEGMYSDGQHSPVSYDFSASSLHFYQEKLQEKFGSTSALNDIFGQNWSDFSELPLPRDLTFDKVDDKRDLIPLMLWSENQNVHQGELYQRFSDTLAKQVPHLYNINPPLADTRGYDFWLTRVVPEAMPIHYGFTNWIGVVSHDETAFLRYLLLVKRARGINLEENWGFSKLYDWRYRYHHIPFYQTVLAMALGATGFNVYTGVSTDQWDDGIDTMQQKPYPDCSPITEHGEQTAKSALLTRLNAFLQTYQQLALLGKADRQPAFGLYLPYSYVACYSQEASDYNKLGEKPLRSGFKALEAYMQSQLAANRDFTIANIETDPVEALLAHENLTVVGGFFMADAVQKKLIEYVELGGQLVWLGELPTVDQWMQPCTVLADRIADRQRMSRTNMGLGQLIYTPENPFEIGGISNSFNQLMQSLLPEPSVTCDSAYLFQYQHNGKQLLYVLSFTSVSMTHTVMVKGQPLQVHLPAKGCAMIVLDGARIDGAFIKGINDYDRSEVAPVLTWAGHSVQADSHGDLLYLNGQLQVWNYPLETN